MKIVWFLTTYGPLGGVRSVIETGNALTRAGHEFYIVGNVGGHKSSFCEDINKARIHIDMSPDERAIGILKSLSDIDIVFSQDPLTMHLLQYVKAKEHVVHYCCADGACYEQFLDIPGTRTSCSKLLNEVSKRQDKDNRYRHHFIGQGINFNEFRPLALTDTPYRKFYDRRKINILCCGDRGGGPKSNKGTHDIIEASKLLDQNKYNFLYFDLTKQRFPPNFTAIETLGMQNIGRTLAQVYAVADIYVAPDYVSAWNCCAGEAMACGKPVICSTPGVADYAVDRENCLVFQENIPESPRMLADKIEYLADNKDERDRLASNGQAAIQEFTWGKVASRIEELV